jgi:hypothetical protein
VILITGFCIGTRARDALRLADGKCGRERVRRVLCSGDDAPLRAAQKTLFKRDEFNAEEIQMTRAD